MDIEVVERDAYHVTIKKTDYNRLLALANEPVNNKMLNLINSYEEQHKAEKEFRNKCMQKVKETEELLALAFLKDEREQEFNKDIKSLYTSLYESEWGVITFFRKLFYGIRT